MEVILRNPTTDKCESLEIGWSWSVLVFNSFFGLPLFARKLRNWGIFMVVVVCLFIIGEKYFDYLILQAMTQRTPGAMSSFKNLALYSNLYKLFTFLFFLSTATIFSFKANKMAGRKFLNEGWMFVEPDSEVAALARYKWRVPGASVESSIEATGESNPTPQDPTND